MDHNFCKNQSNRLAMCRRYSIITKKMESKGTVRAARLLEQAQADNRFNAERIWGVVGTVRTFGT
ncbi:hypothetical protein [Pontibacter flavimaris]|uniref:Uncharacterized protein n=1 Tax=Pontibacter flavimaris TaxID=1797110 RepID=A0A1Q5PBA8_9BACT|nr:hypothetical protein [Pontibacter flavimaris]OKL39515.1 hypothetical protein A3841_00760 [Pontibacter flavimaris]